MIIKSFELNLNKLKNINFFLIYGENQGLKEDLINIISRPQDKKFKYTENDILNNHDLLVDKLYTKSFFEEDKLIIIENVSDKFIPFFEKILKRDIEGCRLILLSKLLEKKSKVRKLFEKEDNVICVPVYKDDDNVLNNIALKFFREKKISISSEIINLITSKTSGDRKNLLNELKKIENYSLNNKKLDIDIIKKLVNLNENHNFNELIDNCLAKNKIKLIKLLNENILSREDAILILRIFLIKAKRIFFLKENLIIEKNLDKLISSYKPPIFWKEKSIVKRQIEVWTSKNIKNLINEINYIELIIKKNSEMTNNILLDFVFSIVKD